MFKVISDLHLGHRNIIKYEPIRKDLGETTEEMDQTLIERWNESTNLSDVVFNLGDFSFHDKPTTHMLMSLMEGSQIFIKGNHDRNRLGLSEHRKILAYRRKPIRLKINGKVYWFSHEPIEVCNNEFNIHGHLHSQSHRGSCGVNHSNVSAEMVGFAPKPLHEIVSELPDLKSYVGKYVIIDSSESVLPHGGLVTGAHGMKLSGLFFSLIYDVDVSVESPLNCESIVISCGDKDEFKETCTLFGFSISKFL